MALKYCNIIATNVANNLLQSQSRDSEFFLWISSSKYAVAKDYYAVENRKFLSSKCDTATKVPHMLWWLIHIDPYALQDLLGNTGCKSQGKERDFPH